VGLLGDVMLVPEIAANPHIECVTWRPIIDPPPVITRKPIISGGRGMIGLMDLTTVSALCAVRLKEPRRQDGKALQQIANALDAMQRRPERVWALHDPVINGVLLSQAKTSDSLCGGLLEMPEPMPDDWAGVKHQFGTATSNLMRFSTHYLRLLVPLALCGLLECVLSKFCTPRDEDLVLRPLFALVLVWFSLWVPKTSMQLEPEKTQAANAYGDDISVRRRRSAGCKLCANGLLLLFFAAQLALALAAIVWTVRTDVWLVYSWAGCSDALDAGLECRSISDGLRSPVHTTRPVAQVGPDSAKGFLSLAFVIEACCGTGVGFVQGLIFQALTASAKVFAWLVSAMHAGSVDEEAVRYLDAVLLLDIGSKVLAMSLMAYWFVPDWGGAPCSASLHGDLGCVKRQLAMQDRALVLQKLAKGPLVVQLVLRQAWKSAVPYLVIRAQRHSATATCCDWLRAKTPSIVCAVFTRVLTVLGRLAALILLLDCAAVGGPMYLCRRKHIAKASAEDQMTQHSETLGEQQAERRIWSNGSAPDDDPWWRQVSVDLGDVFKEGMRQEFRPVDEYCDLLLHFSAVAFFTVHFPLGAALGLLLLLFEQRLHVYTITMVRRRVLRPPSGAFCGHVQRCASVLGVLAACNALSVCVVSYGFVGLASGPAIERDAGPSLGLLAGLATLIAAAQCRRTRKAEELTFSPKVGPAPSPDAAAAWDDP